MARKIHELGFGQPANTAVSPRQVHTTYLKICSIIHTRIRRLDICKGCLLIFYSNVKICFQSQTSSLVEMFRVILFNQ